MSAVTCLRLPPIVYLNDVSFVRPLAALPHQSFREDLGRIGCSGSCKRNHKPGCVMAVTDVPGDTSGPCTVGAVATWLRSPPPSPRWHVLAGQVTTASLPSWAQVSHPRADEQGCWDRLSAHSGSWQARFLPAAPPGTWWGRFSPSH